MAKALPALVLACLPFPAFAADCPVNSISATWRKAACELGNDPKDLLRQAKEISQTGPFSIARSAFYALDEMDAVVFVDWKAGGEDIVWNFERLLAARRARPLSNEEKAMLIDTADHGWNENTTSVDAAVEALLPLLAARNLHLLYIDTRSDQYGFAFVSPQMYCRWESVHLEEALNLMPWSDGTQNMDFGRTAVLSNQPRDCASAKQ